MTPHPSRARRVRRLMVGASLAAAVLAVAAAVATGVLRVPPAHAGGGGIACVSTSGPVCTFKFHSAVAYFEHDGSCQTTYLQVFATESLTREGAAGVTGGPDIQIQDWGMNSCDGTYVYGSSTGFSGTVQASNQGDTLSAQGTVTVLDNLDDGSTNTVTYSISLTWQANGPLTRDVQVFHYRSPYYQLEGHFTGTSSSAAVTGSVSDGTNAFVLSTESYSPMEIDASSGTDVIVYRK